MEEIGFLLIKRPFKRHPGCIYFPTTKELQ